MGLSQQTGKVQSTATASAVSITALGATPSVGDIVVVGIAGYAGGSDVSWTLSGYGVGTWHTKHLAANTGASPPRYAAMHLAWGYIDGTPSKNCTATASASATATIGVAVLSGIGAGATDTSTPAGKATTTSPSSTSYTAASSTKLLVSFFTDDGNGAATAPSSPWTSLTSHGGSADQILQGSYIFGPTTGTKTASWAIGGDTLYTLGLQLDVSGVTQSASASRSETVTFTAHATAVKGVSGSRDETVTLSAGASAVKPASADLAVSAALSASASLTHGAVPLIGLTDDFSSESANWQSWPSEASVASHQLTIAGTNSYPFIVSQSAYDLTDHGMLLKLDGFPTGGGGLTSFIALTDSAFNNWWGFELYDLSGSLQIKGTEYVSGSLVSDDAGTPYDSTAHAWLRIRESGGTVFFEASPDSVTWTRLYSKTWTLPQITALEVQIGAGVASGTANTDPLVVSQLDLPPGSAGASLDTTVTFTASASISQSVDGSLDETISLDAGASAVKGAAAALDATATLTASASVMHAAGSASGRLDETVDLSASASLERSANAALTAHAGLTAAALVDKPAAADLETAVALVASASVRAGIEIFTCPTVQVQERPWTQDLALRFFTQDRALTVLIHQDGSASEVQCPTEAELNDADVQFFFRGGYTHKITSAQSAALKAAGYTTSYV